MMATPMSRLLEEVSREHFLEQVSQGALALSPHRLDFADVMVLRSAAFA